MPETRENEQGEVAPEAPPCPECEEPAAERCSECEEPAAERCSECGLCMGCCPPCDNCGLCEQSCTCVECGSRYCDRRVESVCRRCERCDECCTCEHCAYCEDACEYVCGYCERCDDCCLCIYCEGCGERHSQYTDFCSECECCEDRCSCARDIYNYNTDVLDHLTFQGKPDSGVFLGVELEVQVEGNLADKASAWTDALADFAILKSDASIGRGFEIVTAPCALDIHQKKWAALLETHALTRGLKSWNAEDQCCGMHVHVSRQPITPLTLGKLLVFINSPKTTQPLRALAGRDSERWAKRYAKKLTDGAAKCGSCGEVGKEGYRRCSHCGTVRNFACLSGERYQALNVQNDDTIEFRLFRGTLKLEHVLANIEFVDAVVRWCMQASIQECESWAAFWAFVQKQPKAYKHLLSYMQDK